MTRTASCSSAGCRTGFRILFGFIRRATIVTLGTSSCSSPSRLGPGVRRSNHANPSDVAPRPIDAGDKAAFDRVCRCL